MFLCICRYDIFLFLFSLLVKCVVFRISASLEITDDIDIQNRSNHNITSIFRNNAYCTDSLKTTHFANEEK
jgi:hypothetical protein